MKKLSAILLTLNLFAGLVLLNTGCTSLVPSRISLTPQVGSLEIESVIPLEAALLISEESTNRLFVSAAYPDYKVNPPVYFLEPYQLPIGRAFEAAALKAFAQVFKKITLVRTPEQAGSYLLVVEPKLEDFYLHLNYYTMDYRGMYNQQVDGKCQVKITATVFSKGKPVWQKKIKTPIESGFWVTTPWLDDRVGELAAETLVLGLSDLAVQLAKDNPMK